MVSGSIGLQFAVKNFPIQSENDVRIGVREDFNYIRYGTSFGLYNSGVAFLDSDPITVNKNLILQDFTSVIPENSNQIFTETTKSSQTFTLNNSLFLLSDILKTTSDNQTIPLYYYHDLSSYSSISNIEILDSNYEPVNLDEYLYLDESTVLGISRRGIYTNLRSEYFPEENSYTVYYVKFKNTLTNAFTIELLNPKPFYSKVDFGVTAKTRAYKTETLGNGISVYVYFDSKHFSPTPAINQHRFFVKIIDDSRIKVLKPIDLVHTEKWFLKINPGTFFRSTIHGIKKYTVNEYASQLFSPVFPYKYLIEKEVKIINSQLIYVEPKPLVNLSIEGFYIYVILKDSLGRTQRAITNDPNASVYISPSGVTTEVFYERDMIKSISESDGFIQLAKPINTDLRAYVTFRYIENYYTYKDLSVNPTNNPEVLDKKIILYIRPEDGNKNIFHLLTDENDNIVNSNESSLNNTQISTASNGGLDYLEDVSLEYSTEHLGSELEILSGLNASRKLKISNISFTKSSVTIGDVTVTTQNNTKEFSDYRISFISGGVAGSEIVSLVDKTIQVMIQSGVSTAQQIVDALNGPLLISSFFATTMNPSATQTLRNSTFSIPFITFTVDQNFTSTILPGTQFRINKKFNDYNTLDPISNTLYSYTGWSTKYLSAPNYYILLSNIYAIKTLSPDKIKVTDTRIRGGGIKTRYIEEALKLQDGVQSYWDIGYWDGQPYPGMGVLYIELPRYILKEVGGDFSRVQVKDIVQRHLPEGAYPIIRYYDKATTIEDLIPGDRRLTVRWADIGAAAYNVYYGTDPDNLKLYKTAASIETEMTLLNLENNKLYYVRVESVDNGVACLPSRTVFAMPFNYSKVKSSAVYGRTMYNEGTYSL